MTHDDSPAPRAFHMMVKHQLMCHRSLDLSAERKESKGESWQYLYTKSYKEFYKLEVFFLF